VAESTKNLLNSMKIKTTAVHAKPNASSPAIAILNAGTEPVLATSAAAPSGWTAVEIAGPHEVYVQTKDVMKSLDLKPGANLYTAPKIDAPILTTMVKGDIAEISGTHGRWLQVKLQKKIIGYIGDDSVFSPVVAASNSPIYSSPINAPAGVNATQPSSSPVQVYTGPGQSYAGAGQAAPVVAANTLNPAAAAALPRMFEGTFVPAKRFLAYKPYEYQLNDRAGQRYAFLDVSRLSKAEPIERYLNRVVTVYGAAKAIENTKDIVIEVDSIQTH
jgi:Bacterial SH3 domain